jgi:hypothetical protein
MKLAAQGDQVEGGVDRIGRERAVADLGSLTLRDRSLLRYPAAEVFGTHRVHLARTIPPGFEKLR